MTTTGWTNPYAEARQPRFLPSLLGPLSVVTPPTGQIVTSASDLRFKPRDYETKRDWFNRYRSEGRMSYGSISLYPRNHPDVPKMLAVAERDEAWTNVSRRMYELEHRSGATPEKSRALRAALESWERAVIRAEDA